LALGSNTVRSTTLTGTNTAGGNWNTAANWSLNQVPAPGDDAIITSSGNYTVLFDVSAPVSTC
jgi:hypothetical protein